MNKLDAVCFAILKFEGFTPGASTQEGSQSYRSNNPGNLRAGKGEIGKSDAGFAVFASFADGWEALHYDITVKCSGNSRAKLPDGRRLSKSSTLYDLFHVYAPSSDNNHPIEYANFVANFAHINPNDPIGKILQEG